MMRLGEKTNVNISEKTIERNIPLNALKVFNNDMFSIMNL